MSPRPHSSHALAESAVPRGLRSTLQTQAAGSPNRAFRLRRSANRDERGAMRPRPFYLPTLLFSYFAALSRLAAA